MKIMMNRIMLAAGIGCLLSLASCMKDGDDSIFLEETNGTDIPADKNASANPELIGGNTATIPNVQYTTVSEDGSVVIRLDMTGIQDRNSLEWIRLYGTGEKNQNVWLSVDGKPKGIKVYNSIDDETNASVPVDLVFLVDNSGSMDDEADAIARDISEWTTSLATTDLDIRFGCVGYDGLITGGIDISPASDMVSFLNRAGSSGTSRTVGFIGRLASVSTYKYNGSSMEESGMAALRFADDNFSFRTGANRVYVNFTDEPNTVSNGNHLYSVESLKTDWDTSRGTIHTVFSGGASESGREYNHLMSEYTGGTVLYTNGSFTGVTLSSLPVSDAMRNSYVVRFTNVQEYLDGRAHEVKITVKTPDGVQAERVFNIVFNKTPQEGGSDNNGDSFNGGFGDETNFDGTQTSNVTASSLVGEWHYTSGSYTYVHILKKNLTGEHYILDSNGKISSRTDILQYKVDNGRLFILYEDADFIIDMGKATLAGNVLTLRDAYNYDFQQWTRVSK